MVHSENTKWPLDQLTVCVLETLLLLRRLRDHFDAFAVEHADVGSVAVEHLEREHEVLPLVRVADEQRLGRAVVLQSAMCSVG